jgi:Cu(I)/Ag(I) efflux system protein CusF
MKTATVSLIFALSASSIAFAQSGSMTSMDSKHAMDANKCMDMMNMQGMGTAGMNMKDMDAEKCKAMMNAQGGKQASNDAKVATHHAVAVVQKIDRASGNVTLAHEPVQSLNWPAMTMRFSVKRKDLLDKLAVGQKVNVDFEQVGNGYVVTAVK